MRRILLIIVLCFLAVASTGCKKAQLRRQLKELMSSTIVLPEKITCVYNGEVFPMPDSLRDKPKLIVYIDSTECTTCRISQIGKYYHIFQLLKEKGLFELMLIFPNIELLGIPAERYVLDSEVRCPVYFDIGNKFPELNPSITFDQRLHTILVDHTGTPMFVGDPISSREMHRLFMNAVNKQTNK